MFSVLLRFVFLWLLVASTVTAAGRRDDPESEETAEAGGRNRGQESEEEQSASGSASGFKCGRPSLPFNSDGAGRYAIDVQLARDDYYHSRTTYNGMMGAILSIDFFAMFADGGSYGPGDFKQYSEHIRTLGTYVKITFTYVSYINGDAIATLRLRVSYDVEIFGFHYEYHDIEHDFHFDRLNGDLREVEYRTTSDAVRDGFQRFREDVHRGSTSSSSSSASGLDGGSGGRRGGGSVGTQTQAKASSESKSSKSSSGSKSSSSGKSSSSKSSSKSSSSKSSSGKSSSSSKSSSESDSGSSDSSSSSNGNGKGNGNGKSKYSAGVGQFPSIPEHHETDGSFLNMILEWWILEHPMAIWFVAICGLCGIASAIVYAVRVSVQVTRSGNRESFKATAYEEVHITSGISDMSDEN